MAVMAREAWTDERLDDLNKKVDDGFAEVDKRFDRVETRMERGFSDLNQRLDRMQLALISALVTFCVTLIGSCATLVGVALL
jgi:tetrahydromethanopterin S-methyltransferase subunit G